MRTQGIRNGADVFFTHFDHHTTPCITPNARSHGLLQPSRDSIAARTQDLGYQCRMVVVGLSIASMSSTFIVPVEVSASQLSFKVNRGLRLGRCETITKEEGRKEGKRGQTNFLRWITHQYQTPGQLGVAG